jgi:hypothetical protein
MNNNKKKTAEDFPAVLLIFLIHFNSRPIADPETSSG